MSDEFESFFDTVFGKGGAFEAIFGKGGKIDEALRKSQKIGRRPSSTKKRDERALYQESLMTELLITLAGKGLLTNQEAKDVIRRARERTAQKTAEGEPRVEEKAPEKDEHDAPCGGACPLHDARPHKKLECARCKKATPHLIESGVARCRICLTSRDSW